MWSIKHYPPRTSWSARPIGAPVAVVIGVPDLLTLEQKINGYEADIDWHVMDIRRSHDALPEHWEREREQCDLMITAIANLIYLKAVS